MPNHSIDLHRRRLFVAAASLTSLGRAAAAAPPLEAMASTSTGPVGAPQLAAVYAGQVDPAHSLVSEKYDGVPALWDGRALRHRSGRKVNAPDAFLATLPAGPLDGELWLGRRRFEAASALVRRTAPRADEWAAVRDMVFDTLSRDCRSRHGSSGSRRSRRICRRRSNGHRKRAAPIAPIWSAGSTTSSRAEARG